MNTGSLVVVGTGIRLISQVTPEAQAYIRGAGRVYYLANSSLFTSWLEGINPRAESLYGLYSIGKPRLETYQQMVATMLGPVRDGLDVCAVFYGHPGVFVYPTHEAIRQARSEGLTAFMLPAISAEDCLFADLGIDPGRDGCQSYEVTDFLIRTRNFDPRSHLILWQVGAVGDLTYNREATSRGLDVLADYLTPVYGASHEVVLYEAAILPVCDARIRRVPLQELPAQPSTWLSTLYVPPKERPALNVQMMERLGMPASSMTATA